MGGTELFDIKNNNQRNYEIAYSLYEVNETRNLRPEYKNIVEFAKKHLGYSQAMTYKMLAVGRKFIYIDNEQYVNIFDRPFNISQLIQMTEYDPEKLKFLLVRDVINENMTVKELRKVLKNQLK